MTLEWIFSATVLILAVLLIHCLLGQKMSARLRYGLWLLVLVRLLLPFSIGHSTVSPANFVDRAARPHSVVSAPALETESTLPAPSTPTASGSGIAESVSSEAPTPSPAPVTPTAGPAASPVQVTFSWQGIWKAGMAAAALWFLFCNGLFYLRLRRNRRLLNRIGATAVYAADAPSPCLFGLLRPAIYLTPAAQADPVIRRHVLLHEKTHLRHGDQLWAFLRTVCLVLWWFHPLVWLAAWLSRKDCELCCDEAVIRRMGEEQRIPYGRTLLLLAAEKQPVTAFCTVTTLSRSGRQLKARITAIARRVRPRVWAMVLAALLALLAMGCAFAGAAEESAPDADDNEAAVTQESTSDAVSEEGPSSPTPLTDADLLLHHGVRLGMNYEEVLSRVGTPAKLEDDTADYRTFRLDGVYYRFYAGFGGNDYHLDYVSTEDETALLSGLNLNVGGTLEDVLAALGLPADLKLEDQEMLYGTLYESKSAVVQKTTSEAGDGWMIAIIAENSSLQVFLNDENHIDAVILSLRGMPRGLPAFSIWDDELVSPAGTIGTSLEEAEAQAGGWDAQESQENTITCVSGVWEYTFQLDPTEGGYWLSGWKATGTETLLDFHGYHTLSDFLDRLGCAMPEAGQTELQLYGQAGAPLSGSLTHEENGPYVVTILTERYRMVLTFNPTGPLQWIAVSGTPEQVRPLPAVTDDQLVSGHGLFFGMTYEEALDKLGAQAQVDLRDDEGLRCITMDNIQYTFYPEDDGIYYLRQYRSLDDTGGKMPLGLELGDTLSDILRALGSKSETRTVGTLRGTAWMPDSILVTDAQLNEVHIFTPNGCLIQMYLNPEDVIWSIDCSDRTLNRGSFLAQELYQTYPDASVYSAIVADDEDLGTIGAIMYLSRSDSCNHIACGTGDPVVQITQEVTMDAESSSLGATPLTYEGNGRFSFLDGEHRTWYVDYDPMAGTCTLEVQE